MSDHEASIAPTRRVAVVLGMHRSGTSLVAGCIQRLGVDFGPRLMPPNANNPRGYFEHNDVVNLHDRVLLTLNRSWDDVSPLPPNWWQDDRLTVYRTMLISLLRRDFGASFLWGLKDPRMCRLLPWWDSIWTELAVKPVFVVVRRDPLEIAASLARREGTSPPKSHLLTLRHLLEAEHGSRPHERIIVDVADFVADEDSALKPIRRALELPPRVDPPAERHVDHTLVKSGAHTDNESLPTWLVKGDAALRLGLAGHEREMRFILGRLSDQLRDDPSGFAQEAAVQKSDLVQELETSRKQARWYEEEWRKAQGKVEKLRTRLDKQK